MKIKTSILFFLVLFISSAVKSQNETAKDSIYSYTEVMPEFPGGPEKLMQYVASNLFMPVNCKKEYIPSKLNISFVVNTGGEVVDIQFKESIGCEEFEAQIKNIFLSMPLWKPGEQDGKVVKVKMFFPLIIELK